MSTCICIYIYMCVCVFDRVFGIVVQTEKEVHWTVQASRVHIKELPFNCCASWKHALPTVLPPASFAVETAVITLSEPWQ